MGTLRAELRPDLSRLDEHALAEVTADGHTFASAEWYRFLESIDLSLVAGGDTKLAFAVVTEADRPVCVCPVLRVRGPGVFFAYNLRRYFFDHWIGEVRRKHPRIEGDLARLLRGVTLYRRFLDWSHAPLDECLIVGSPLAYRSQIPTAPSATASRGEIYRILVALLQKVSRKNRLPLWFFCVQGEKGRLPRALLAAGCQRSFLFHDNVVELDDYRSFSDYLQSFRRTARKAFLREIRLAESAGIDFTVSGDVAEIAEEIADACLRGQERNGQTAFRQPVEFWRSLGRSLGHKAEAIVATRHEDPLGFHVLLRNERRGEMWAYRMGRADIGARTFACLGSSLGFYEPIRRAVALGYRRIWLGPTAYEAKSLRGARQVPLYSYFWFPRVWDRWLFLPYLVQFGEIAREQIARSLNRPRIFQPGTAPLANREAGR